jgi:hypothetical protein
LASWALNRQTCNCCSSQTCRTTVALGWEIVEVPKSETQVSADLWDEADTIELAHALADYHGRTVVVVWTDDKEVIVEPRAERRLDN